MALAGSPAPRAARQVTVEDGPLVVWRFTDGKRGHENQSLGLIEALGELLPLDVQELAKPNPVAAAAGLLLGRFPRGAHLPDPELIVGAGHATHIPMLAARRARGGRVISLMTPSLPTRWFDLCVVPQHDRVRPAAHVFETRGVLTRIKPSRDHDEGRGLILVGGPSAHHAWSEASLLAQIRSIFERAATVSWTISTSRRTPARTLDGLRHLTGGRARVIPFDRVSENWLPSKLARAGAVWVTADSVSMVYEALSAGAAVGVLEINSRRPSRVTRGLDSLLEDGLVTTYRDWQSGAALRAPMNAFNEAGRCARWIATKWLPSH